MIMMMVVVVVVVIVGGSFCSSLVGGGIGSRIVPLGNMFLFRIYHCRLILLIPIPLAKSKHSITTTVVVGIRCRQ